MTEIDYYKISGNPVRKDGEKYTAFPAVIAGNPPEKGEFSIFPSGKKVLIKQVRTNGGAGEFFIHMKGRGAMAARQGSLVIPRYYGASEGRKALVAWKGNPPDSRSLNLSMRDLADFSYTGKVASSRTDRVSKITGNFPFLQIPGQLYCVSGEDYSGEFVLLMGEPFTDSQMKDLSRRVNKYGNFPGPVHIYSMNLRVRGYVQVPPGIVPDGFQGALPLGDWFVMSRTLEKWKALIEKRACHEAGLAESELPGLLDIPEALREAVLGDLISKHIVYRIKGALLNCTDTPEQFLAPMTRSYLNDLKNLSTGGLNLREKSSPGRPDLPDILVKRNLAKKLENILYSAEAFEELVSQVKEILPSGQAFDLGDLTGKTSLSRSRLIALLDAMEEEGILRSVGQNRRKLV